MESVGLFPSMRKVVGFISDTVRESSPKICVQLIKGIIT